MALAGMANRSSIFEDGRVGNASSASGGAVEIPLYFLYSFIPLPCISLLSLCFGFTCTLLTLLQLRFLL